MYNEFTLSTIICSHNEQDFIEESVASLCLDTYVGRELLVVDDASRDNTVPIVKKLAKQFRNLRFFRFDKNMGPGIARNFALLQARGKYVHFLDADDTVVAQELSKAVEILEQSRAESIRCPHIRILPEVTRVFSSARGEFTGEEAFRQFITLRFGSWSAWAAVYKRESLLESGSRFQQGFLYEDVIFCCNALYKSGRVIGHDVPFYVYRCTNPSITRGVEAQGLGHTMGSARMYYDVCMFFAMLPNSEDYEKELAFFCEIMAMEHAPRMLRSLQGEEFKRSLAAQRELLFYLSIKESVFTRALTSVLNISAS